MFYQTIIKEAAFFIYVLRSQKAVKNSLFQVVSQESGNKPEMQGHTNISILNLFFFLICLLKGEDYMNRNLRS